MTAAAARTSSPPLSCLCRAGPATAPSDPVPSGVGGDDRNTDATTARTGVRPLTQPRSRRPSLDIGRDVGGGGRRLDDRRAGEDDEQRDERATRPQTPMSTACGENASQVVSGSRLLMRYCQRKNPMPTAASATK